MKKYGVDRFTDVLGKLYVKAPLPKYSKSSGLMSSLFGGKCSNRPECGETLYRSRLVILVIPGWLALQW